MSQTGSIWFIQALTENSFYNFSTIFSTWSWNDAYFGQFLLFIWNSPDLARTEWNDYKSFEILLVCLAFGESIRSTFYPRGQISHLVLIANQFSYVRTVANRLELFLQFNRYESCLLFTKFHVCFKSYWPKMLKKLDRSQIDYASSMTIFTRFENKVLCTIFYW